MIILDLICNNILCGSSWLQKLYFENLALAPGFAGERHIWQKQAETEKNYFFCKETKYVQGSTLAVAR